MPIERRSSAPVLRELEVSAVLLSPCQRQLEQISVCGVFLFAILPAAVSALASHVAKAADGICRVGVDFHAQPLAQNGFAFPQSKEDGLELPAVVRLRLSFFERLADVVGRVHFEENACSCRRVGFAVVQRAAVGEHFVGLSAKGFVAGLRPFAVGIVVSLRRPGVCGAAFFDLRNVAEDSDDGLPIGACDEACVVVSVKDACGHIDPPSLLRRAVAAVSVVDRRFGAVFAASKEARASRFSASTVRVADAGLGDCRRAQRLEADAAVGVWGVGAEMRWFCGAVRAR